MDRKEDDLLSAVSINYHLYSMLWQGCKHDHYNQTGARTCLRQNNL